MFNNDFFPTPKSVIHQMLKPYLGAYRDSGYYHQSRSTYYFKEKKRPVILEPSGGKGDILDYLHTECNVPKKNLYAIEKEPELQYTIQGKEYKFIHDDFLTYQGDYKFDMIVMNPPFSAGAKHLLKAWEIAENTEIVCLLNEETIKNPYTKERQQLTYIIEQYGSVEFLGNVFADAERKTAGTGIALVRLSKVTEKTQFDFEFENVTSESGYELNEEVIGNGVMMNDIIGNMLRQYEMTKQAYMEYMEAKKKMEFYSSGLIAGTKSIGGMAEESYNFTGSMHEKYNIFIDDFKLDTWKNILTKLNIEKYLTHKVRKNFQDFTSKQGSMDLTRENIHALILMIAENQHSIYEQAVCDVFDIFTKYYTENRENPEGWVTNNSWIVKEKVILPRFVEVDFDGYYSRSVHKWDQYSDIEKVMCYLSGKNYDDIDKPAKDYPYGTNTREMELKMMGLVQAIKRVPVGSTSWHDSEFFMIRCYKKGTIHLKFKDEELRARFNQVACQGKFGLPYEPKKKSKKRSNNH